MDIFPCTCGGNNPNCFKCYGTGLISASEKPIAWPSTQLPKLRKMSTTKESKRPQEASIKSIGHQVAPGFTPKPVAHIRTDTIVCPACKQEFHFRYFPTHRQQYHPIAKDNLKPVVPKKKIPSKSNRLLYPCPECQVQVCDLAKHLKKQHGPETKILRELKVPRTLEDKELSPQGAHAISKYRSSHLTGKICGFCGITVPGTSELKAHLYMKHGFDEASLSNKSARQYPENSSATRRIQKNKEKNKHHLTSVTPSDPRAEELRERRMDPTYGMGGTARDNGQFGSPVSFDGMDDESLP